MNETYLEKIVRDKRLVYVVWQVMIRISLAKKLIISIMRDVRVLSSHQRALLAHQHTFGDEFHVSVYLGF